jgi:hypothetical protein
MFPQGLYTLPIIESMKIYMPDDYDDERFLKRAFTNLKWCLWPRRCHVSGRWMWLTLAYKSDYIINGPGDAAVWTRWYSPTEMLILKLKYNVNN